MEIRIFGTGRASGKVHTGVMLANSSGSSMVGIGPCTFSAPRGNFTAIVEVSDERGIIFVTRFGIGRDTKEDAT